MERYDYEEAMKADIRQYLEENWEKGKRITDDDRSQLHDDMFVADSVTGNGSGSYTFNSFKAEEYVCHNLELLGDACEEFCVDGDTLAEKLCGEWADVTIRCYMLGQVEGEVFDAWNEECENVKAENDLEYICDKIDNTEMLSSWIEDDDTICVYYNGKIPVGKGSIKEAIESEEGFPLDLVEFIKSDDDGKSAYYRAKEKEEDVE